MRYYVPMVNIPDRFKDGDPFSRWGSRLFFAGGSLPKDLLREGLDFADVKRRLQVMLGTFESKHEHKEAAVGYFLSIAFREVPK